MNYKDYKRRNLKIEIDMKRPEISDQTIREAAAQIATQLDAAPDDIVEHFRPHMDGYELAKKLEDYAHWDITLMDVETLDCMDSTVDELHRKVLLEWVKENDIKPPLPIGTMTTKGEITGINEYSAAKYEIKEPDQDDNICHRRLLVDFEDAVAA